MMLYRVFRCLSLCGLLAMPAAAQFGPPGAAPASRAELVAGVQALAPGKPFTVALKISYPQEWHGYYRNSGGVEQGLAIEWALPEGFRAGPLQWPAPQVKDGFFGKSFIYEGTAVFLTEIMVPATLETGGTVTLGADASWQICKESCINERKIFSLKLPVAKTATANPAAAEIIAAARAKLPATPAGWKFSARAESGEIVLRVADGGTLKEAPADFVPDQPFVKSLSSGGSTTRDGEAWLIRLPRATKDALDNEIPQGGAFSGVLLGSHPVAVPETRIAAPAAATPPAKGFAKILWGMFLGGLILNLMPCVFPVIGLKIMGFVQQAGTHRGKVALHGTVFALGVLASFGVLSGLLFAARSALGADAVGWGYQLQNPWVVAVLMLLMFVLALNLCGVFEIGTSATSLGGSLQSKHGLAGSFFSGVLATVVATPCSGPFLGVAIGAAVGLPALHFFSAFAAMAAGLALPYLLLSVFPQLLSHLPRPGAWMESFKQGMSFLLFATAAYLLWVYGGLIGLENLLGPLLGLSAIGAAVWVHGRWNLPHRTRPVRIAARFVALGFAALGVLLAMPPKPSALTWEPWSEARVAELLDEGRPVYVDFTAQWCATCQVNKKRAYTTEVIDLLRKKNVATLKADKTRPDPAIEAALQKLGRSAIPVNVLLAPGKQPLILPELLSPADLLDALGKL